MSILKPRSLNFARSEMTYRYVNCTFFFLHSLHLTTTGRHWKEEEEEAEEEEEEEKGSGMGVFICNSNDLIYNYLLENVWNSCTC